MPEATPNLQRAQGQVLALSTDGLCSGRQMLSPLSATAALQGYAHWCPISHLLKGR